MPKFGNRSEENLVNVHPDLIQVCRFVIEAYDFTVLCGYRGEAEQNAAYPKYTKVKFPNSKHNAFKIVNGKEIPESRAVDLIPYDSVRKSIVGWNEYEAMAMLAGHIMMSAYAFGINIRWGHDWNINGSLWDEKGKLADRPHFELIG